MVAWAATGKRLASPARRRCEVGADKLRFVCTIGDGLFLPASVPGAISAWGISPAADAVSSRSRSLNERRISLAHPAQMNLEDAVAAQIGDTAPDQVTELVLDACKATKVTGLDKFVNLQNLTLNGCGLKSLDDFPTLSELRALELSDNQLVDGSLEALQDAGLLNLRRLSLAGNRFSTVEALEPLVRAHAAAVAAPPPRRPLAASLCLPARVRANAGGKHCAVGSCLTARAVAGRRMARARAAALTQPPYRAALRLRATELLRQPYGARPFQLCRD